jgi:uncharacterized membrane protein
VLAQLVGVLWEPVAADSVVTAATLVEKRFTYVIAQAPSPDEWMPTSPYAALVVVAPVSWLVGDELEHLAPWEAELRWTTEAGKLIENLRTRVMPGTYIAVLVDVFGVVSPQSSPNFGGDHVGSWGLTPRAEAVTAAVATLESSLLRNDGDSASISFCTDACRTVLLELSENPGDGSLRLRLEQALDPGHSGSYGIAMLTVIASECEVVVDVESSLEVLPVPVEPEVYMPFFKALLEDRARAGVFALMPEQVPAHLVPDDGLESYLAGAIEIMRCMLQDADATFDVETFKCVVKAAIDLAVTVNGNIRVIQVYRMAAQIAALAHAPQFARDLIESVLLLGAASIEERCLAWMSFADTYLRTHAPREALQAWCCGAMAGAPVEPEAILLRARILRELGMVVEAQRLVAEHLDRFTEVRGERWFKELSVFEAGLALLLSPSHEDCLRIPSVRAPAENATALTNECQL